jgi:hypothetical protein
MPNLPYDITTPLGQTRFYAADTVQDCDGNYTFSDAELNMMLALPQCQGPEGQVIPQLAAAWAFDALAGDSARLATVSKYGDRSLNGTKLATELRAQAAELRRQAPVPGSIHPPRREFRLDGYGDCGPWPHNMDW